MDLWNGGHPGSQRGPERADWDNLIEEIRTTQDGFNGKDGVTLQSIGAVASVDGLTVKEYGDGAVHKTVLTLDEVGLATADGSTPATDGAWATKQLYTFPIGTKALLVAAFDLDSLEDNAGEVGLSATADFDLGLGSIPVEAETAFSLESTLSDYAEATVALVDSESSDSDTNITAATHTATGLHLNLRTVDDADHGEAAGLLKVSGTVIITWTMVK